MTEAGGTERQMQLYETLSRLALLLREPVDRLSLLDASQGVAGKGGGKDELAAVCKTLSLRKPVWSSAPDAANLPALMLQDGNWSILRGQNARTDWIVDSYDAKKRVWLEKVCTPRDLQKNVLFAVVDLHMSGAGTRNAVLKLVTDEIWEQKGILFESLVGGALLSFLGIAISLYSLQVYDRVVPTGATQTLLVLTLGVIVILFFELLVRIIRSRLYAKLVEAIDRKVARAVYLRFLAVRLDQLPTSVGTLAGQLRGYESVRNFIVAFTSQLAVDIPFALLFVAVIALIAGPLALIPLSFFFVALPLGLWQSRKLMGLSGRSHATANMQIGLLVESVEGAEIIKSGQGGWRMLNRWLAVTDASRSISIEIQNENDRHRYGAMALQQLVYVFTISAGALMIGAGTLTMGGIVASSILSGRILSPITQLGALVGNLANVKVALRGLDALWRLEDDHFGHDQPIYLENIEGGYRFENVTMRIGGNPVLAMPRFEIKPGEKLAIMGPIGSGKTTLLRLLSGMYRPTEGRIWLDHADLAMISKPVLAERLGYLPQEGRLLAGTLRDNLTLGILDPGDEAILAAARKTGLFDAVLATHPQGLQREIAEGGSGLSGGQRQLVNLTRVFLRKPRIWLLDEPTAAVDQDLERLLITALRGEISPKDTLVVVTHKPQLLALVDRIVVVSGGRIVADGPTDKIMDVLTRGAAQASAEPVRRSGVMA